MITQTIRFTLLSIHWKLRSPICYPFFYLQKIQHKLAYNTTKFKWIYWFLHYIYANISIFIAIVYRVILWKRNALQTYGHWGKKQLSQLYCKLNISIISETHNKIIRKSILRLAFKCQNVLIIDSSDSRVDFHSPLLSYGVVNLVSPKIMAPLVNFEMSQFNEIETLCVNTCIEHR